MLKRISLLGLILVTMLTACTEETMKKLASNTFDPNLSIPFWDKQISENSDLWKEALPYCQANPQKVNCVAVRKAWGRYNFSQFVAAEQATRPGPDRKSVV